MEKKLFDSELKIMQLIWQHEPVSAKKVSLLADDAFGWNKNTTYTVIKKLAAKGAVRRDEPGFICSSLIKREDVILNETRSLVDRLCGGSRKMLFAALIDDELTPEEAAELHRLIEDKL